MASTEIEWADAVWNPVTGCTPISPGCENCYAERMAKRLAGRCGYPADEPFRVTLHPERLEEPLRWKKPRRVFVCSMGDLFHDDVDFDFIDQIFAVMALCPQHTFLILTKRPDRMLNYMNFTELGCLSPYMESWGWISPEDAANIAPPGSILPEWPKWPLTNVWAGVTAENQAAADERIPILLQIPAVVRFVSVEPMLGLIRLQRDWLMCPGGAEYGHGMSLTRVHAGGCCDRHPRLHWVICGGETGPGARPMHPDWVRNLRDQCIATEVPFFLKQMHIGGKLVKMPDLDGQVWGQLPQKA